MSFSAGVLDTTLNLVTTKALLLTANLSFLPIYPSRLRQPAADILELENVKYDGCYCYCSLNYCANQNIKLQ